MTFWVQVELERLVEFILQTYRKIILISRKLHMQSLWWIYSSKGPLFSLYLIFLRMLGFQTLQSIDLRTNGSVNFSVRLVRSTAPGTETAQQLSVLTVFAEDMGSVPCAHILKLTTTCSSGSRWSFPGVCGYCIHVLHCCIISNSLCFQSWP